MKVVLTCFTAFAVCLCFTMLFPMAHGQSMDFNEIQAALETNPPGTGDTLLREQAILNLDEYLKRADAPSNPDLLAFYRSQIADLADAVAEPVLSGARIWQIYNHGYIVKTPSATFAFDLVTWRTTLPDELLMQIDVAFVSHRHSDHSGWPSNSIKRLGGVVVGPPQDWQEAIAGTHENIRGLEVNSSAGLHSVPNSIFLVTTAEGLTIMHTGDTQRSHDLPEDIPVDVLLINAWMNESGFQTATEGVRNAINRISPSLTIPGHIQELGHAYNPASVSTRVLFEWALAVDDVPIPGELGVMAYGELYEYMVVPEPTSWTALVLGAGGVIGGYGQIRRSSGVGSPL